jgi:N-carbamoylputrescine amidase
MRAGDRGWQRLVARVRALKPDVLLLNEMPFGRWLASSPRCGRIALEQSHALHREGAARLGEFRVPVVLGSQASWENGRSVNQGFLWTEQQGLVVLHTKQFFPDEPGYYEARWFQNGKTRFRVGEANGLRVGFLICTDVWFAEWARYYGRCGVHLIAVPRATPRYSLDRWKIGISAVALISGCYVASSNRAGRDSSGQVFGGRGWIVDPAGRCLAETSSREPVAAAVIDLRIAEVAKGEYPRYVAEPFALPDLPT